MSWPPKIGDPLPRAAGAWYTQAKLNWILGSKIQVVRDRFPFGITCGVEVHLEINDRNAPTTISWHYAIEIAPPRLVTAFPTP